MSSDYAIPGLMPLTSPVAETEAPLPSVLEPHSLAQTLWQGIESIGPYTINDLPPYFSAEKVTMTLINGNWPCVSYTLSSEPVEGEGTITIHDSATWWFSIEAQALPLLPGIWEWKIFVTDFRGEILPIFSGILPITP